MGFAEVSAKTGENVKDTMRGFVFEILREKVRLINMKDEFLTMLLGLNEDFDDDLLQDAM